MYIMVMDTFHEKDKQWDAQQHNPGTMKKFTGRDNKTGDSSDAHPQTIDTGFGFPFSFPFGKPAAKHAGLGQGEGQENTDGIQRHERMRAGLKKDDQSCG